jgi:beta-N-acetylhexosaminidase
MRKKKLAIISVAVFVLLAAVLALFILLRPEPTPPSVGEQSPPPPPSHIDTVMNAMSLEEKAASLLVLHTPGTSSAALSEFVEKYNIGGLILMGDNIPPDHTELKQLASTLYGDDAKLPRLVATDQEGGTVQRIPGDDFDSALTLKDQSPSAAYTAFEQRSRLVQPVGVTLNFGIVADVTANQTSFIYPRVLGTTPHAAADRVAAAVKASRGKTLSTLKHFPGHGETAADSHTSIPTTDVSFEHWRQYDRLPFAAGVHAGAEAVMLGHLRYVSVDGAPASLSAKWHDILRNDLQFKGVAITDDMIMLQHSGDPAFADPVQNAVSALAAGSDMLLYVLNNADDPASRIDPQRLVDGIVAAMKNGVLDAAKVDQSVRRVLDLREKSAPLIER